MGTARRYRQFAAPLCMAALLALPAFATDSELIWARRMGGTSVDEAQSVAVDSSNNVYITGRFQDTADFDPGPATVNLTASGSNDIFVTKLDSAGGFVWARRMGGINNDRSHCIAVDSAGNTYTTGTFQGTVDFDPGAGTLNFTANGLQDAFVLKLDSAGDLVWARQFQGNAIGLGESIAVDALGNTYITGQFTGAVDFDPGAGVSTLTATGTATFIVKLTAAGDFGWARHLGGGASPTHGESIAVDSNGNAYLTGFFEGVVDFNPGPGTSIRTAVDRVDLYVVKFDTSGTFKWVAHMGGDEYEWSDAIVVDSAANVYHTGGFNGTVDFDPGPSTHNLTAIDLEDAYICKLDSSGNLVWVRQIGGVDYSFGFGIAMDAFGNIFTNGTFSGVTDFDAGPESFALTSVGDTDSYLTKYDSLGNFIWAVQLGGESTVNANAIAVHPGGTVYATGYFNASSDFDPGPSETELTSAGFSDIFVIELSGLDTDPPNATAIAPSTVGPTNADTLDFAVTFDEPVQNFNDASDVVITHTGTANSGVTVTGGQVTYTVTIEGITGDGTFTLAANTASDIADLSSNPLGSSDTSAPVTIDNTAPAITVLGANPIQLEQYVPYTDPGATANDTLDGNITDDIISDTGAVDTATPGTYTITYNVTDTAGNPAPQATRSVQVNPYTGPSLPLNPWLLTLALTLATAVSITATRRFLQP